MENKKEQNIIEREYIIPLREKIRAVSRYKRANKAVKSIKEFLVRHMNIYDRDLNKIKIDKYLNEHLWFRGIRKPPYKVKVKVKKDGEFVRVELAELPEKLKFKKIREEKLIQKAEAAKKPSVKSEAKKVEKVSKKEEPEDKGSEQVQASSAKIVDRNKDGIDDKKEETEKKTAVVEAGQKFEKTEHKKQKHMTKVKTSIQEAQERTTKNKVY